MKKLDLTGLGDLVAASTHVAADGGIYGDHPLEHIRISRTNRKRFNAEALAKLATNIASGRFRQNTRARPAHQTFHRTALQFFRHRATWKRGAKLLRCFSWLALCVRRQLGARIAPASPAPSF